MRDFWLQRKFRIGWPGLKEKPKVPLRFNSNNRLGEPVLSAIFTKQTLEQMLGSRGGEVFEFPNMNFIGDSVKRAAANTSYGAITWPSGNDTEYTVIWRGKRNSTTNEYVGGFLSGGSASGAYVPGFKFSNTAGGSSYVFDTTHISLGSNIAQDDNDGMATYVIRSTDAGGGQVTYTGWIDGIKGNSPVTRSAPNVGGKKFHVLGGFNRSATPEWEFIHLFDRALTDAEVALFFEDEWALYEPAVPTPLGLVGAGPVGGGPKTVTVAIAGASTAAVALGAIRPVAPTIAGASTAAITVSKIGAVKTVTVAVAATSTVSAVTSATKVATVGITGASTTTVVAGAIRTVQPAIAAQSTVAISAFKLGNVKTVTVAIASASAVAAIISRFRGVVVAIAGAGVCAIAAVKTAIAQVAVAAQSTVAVVASSFGTQTVQVAINGVSAVAVNVLNLNLLWTPVTAATTAWTEKTDTFNIWTEI